MRRCSIALILLLALPPLVSPASEGEDLYYDTCLQCHGDYATDDWQRSRKSWELTVYRMQSYADFSDETAEKIIDYLAGDEQPEPEEDSLADTLAEDQQPVVEEPESPAEALAREERFRKQQEIAAAQLWNPSPPVLIFARYMGYFAVACLVGLGITGLARRKLARRFRLVHTAAAAGLLVAIGAHAVIDLFEYGAPPVLWLWFGIAATALPVVGLATGYMRRVLGSAFKPVHYGFAVTGLTLAVLHWIWIYI